MATTDCISLRVINQSADLNNSSIVLFQKNVSTNINELPVAWLVIENLGAGWIHPFKYELDLQVGVADSWGNYLPPQNSDDGQLWTLTRDGSREQLNPSGPANSASEIQVLNGLAQGAITACMYRSGQLLATKTGVAPGQKAMFAFKPSLWIGVVSRRSTS